MSDAARRDNGLRADSYVRLGEVSTPLVEGLLDRLRAESVAAYTAPTVGRRGPYGDTLLPSTPTDAIWVDSARMTHAAEVLSAYLSAAEEDLAWAGIVADFERDSPNDPVPRWPAIEDLPEGRHEETVETELFTAPVRAPAPPSSEPLDQEHYVPPPPPPLPVPDTIGRFAWTGAVGGPLLLLLAALTGFDLPQWAGALAVGAFVGGFVTLVARMQDGPPTDSGPDDGAVV